MAYYHKGSVQRLQKVYKGNPSSCPFFHPLGRSVLSEHHKKMLFSKGRHMNYFFIVDEGKSVDLFIPEPELITFAD